MHIISQKCKLESNKNMAFHVHVVHTGALPLTKALVIYLHLKKKAIHMTYFFHHLKNNALKQRSGETSQTNRKRYSIVFSSYTNQPSSSLQYIHVLKHGDYQGLNYYSPFKQTLILSIQFIQFMESKRIFHKALHSIWLDRLMFLKYCIICKLYILIFLLCQNQQNYTSKYYLNFIVDTCTWYVIAFLCWVWCFPFCPFILVESQAQHYCVILIKLCVLSIYRLWAMCLH